MKSLKLETNYGKCTGMMKPTYGLFHYKNKKKEIMYQIN